MSPIEGVWYDGLSSKQTRATLSKDAEGTIQVRFGETTLRTNAESIRISDRLGRTPRQMVFTQGTFETLDNDAVDALGIGPRTLVQGIERRYLFIILLLLGVAGAAFGGIKYGIPVVAKLVAVSMPASTVTLIGDVLMKSLTQLGLEPSKLSKQKQRLTQQRFDSIAANLKFNQQCRLRIQGGGDTFRANALALPPCVVVLTDELVELAKTQDELDAVLAHEFGHIYHRHNLRSIVQGSLLSFIFLLITGDATQISASVAAVPMVLTQLAYSREFEREADRFALMYMTSNGISLAAFPQILKRIGCWTPDNEETYQACLEHDYDRADSGFNAINRVTSYMLTHPSTEDRALMFRAQRSD